MSVIWLAMKMKMEMNMNMNMNIKISIDINIKSGSGCNVKDQGLGFPLASHIYSEAVLQRSTATQRCMRACTYERPRAGWYGLRDLPTAASV